MTDKNNKLYCQICGLECREEDLYSYEHCVCCGAEFGYHDDNVQSIVNYRNNWFESGARWYLENNSKISMPKNWDLHMLKLQLENIDFLLTNELIDKILQNRNKKKLP